MQSLMPGWPINEFPNDGAASSWESPIRQYLTSARLDAARGDWGLAREKLLLVRHEIEKAIDICEARMPQEAGS